MENLKLPIQGTFIVTVADEGLITKKETAGSDFIRE